MNIAIGTTQDRALYEDALRVRRLVFIEEQNVPEDEEIDAFEDDSFHLVLYDGQTPVGAGRLRFIDEGVGKIERICVLPSYRGRGAGRMVMEAIEQLAKTKGAKTAKLNAQTHAEPFYKKLGYTTVSGVFMDAGIPHVTMVKSLE
ncbi:MULTISPECIES: GNAT family N-acetyltransferase [Geobacillus]|uniref:GNAT family N-acetyltransferase n=1 Tax=Geobacillus zalihae TaxID=213419 RepID=A0A7H1RV91_9BACL|nr:MULTISPECIES: GNAT family N-acetyltransferase [Geobacillus]ALA71153.1 acetyltransferase [Geobacillus stearothermophilus 10]ADI27631.1 GCN5-related N-acetyltransferase [Geobacillus sp. C56-T3]ADU93273.1 GCN5-related N-acetyltransferase [Geobacillus sp. Y412MC52]AGE21346.1 GCN5-related N-acetyltransferase [Geobacillus sp. GHH01]AMQ19911.1 acetyltransferase [Geobacillus sp. JS12]